MTYNAVWHVVMGLVVVLTVAIGFVAVRVLMTNNIVDFALTVGWMVVLIYFGHLLTRAREERQH